VADAEWAGGGWYGGGFVPEAVYGGGCVPPCEPAGGVRSTSELATVAAAAAASAPVAEWETWVPCVVGAFLDLDLDLRPRRWTGGD
jgi:hypothetical protein